VLIAIFATLRAVKFPSRTTELPL